MRGNRLHRPRWRGRGAAQSTIEFALVAPLFLLCLFGAIDAALWSIETSAAVSAAEQGARVAASAFGDPSQSQVCDSQNATKTVFDQVSGRLRLAMFGTAVTKVEPSSSDPCNSPDTCPKPTGVADRTLVVCAHYSKNGSDPPMVTVHIVGYVASLVPPVFGLGWKGGEIPIDVGATTHTLTFTQ